MAFHSRSRLSKAILLAFTFAFCRTPGYSQSQTPQPDSEEVLAPQDLVDTINLLRGSILIIQTSDDIGVIEDQEALLWDQIDMRLIADPAIAEAINDYLVFLNNIVVQHGNRDLIRKQHNIASSQSLSSAIESSIADMREQAVIGAIAMAGGPYAQATYLVGSISYRLILISLSIWDLTTVPETANLELEQDLFALAVEERKQLTEIRLRFLKLLGDLLQDDRIEAEAVNQLLIRDDQLNALANALTVADPQERLTRLRGLERALTRYAPYWFYRGSAEALTSDLPSAFDSFSRYDAMRSKILIRDQMLRSRLIAEATLRPSNPGDPILSDLLSRLDQFLFDQNDPAGELAIAMAFAKAGDFTRAVEHAKQVATIDEATRTMANEVRIAIELARQTGTAAPERIEWDMRTLYDDLQQDTSHSASLMLRGWTASGNREWLIPLLPVLNRIHVTATGNRFTLATGTRDLVVQLPEPLRPLAAEASVVVGDIDFSDSTAWIPFEEAQDTTSASFVNFVSKSKWKREKFDRLRVRLRSSTWDIDLIYSLEYVDDIEARLIGLETWKTSTLDYVKRAFGDTSIASGSWALGPGDLTLHPWPNETDTRVGVRADPIRFLESHAEFDAAKKDYTWSDPDKNVYVSIPSILASNVVGITVDRTQLTLGSAGSIPPTAVPIEQTRELLSSRLGIEASAPSTDHDDRSFSDLADQLRGIFPAADPVLIKRVVLRALASTTSESLELRIPEARLHSVLSINPTGTMQYLDMFGESRELRFSLTDASDRIADD